MGVEEEGWVGHFRETRKFVNIQAGDNYTKWWSCPPLLSKLVDRTWWRWSYLATVLYRGMVNKNGCQEMSAVPPPLLQLPQPTDMPMWFLDLSNIKSDSLTFPTSNPIPWPFQHPKLSGHVYWLRLFKREGTADISWLPLLFTVPRNAPSPSTIHPCITAVWWTIMAAKNCNLSLLFK